MSTIDDLKFINAPVTDPVQTALFIGGLILTRKQKAALLMNYLTEKRLTLTPEIRAAADAYAEAL